MPPAEEVQSPNHWTTREVPLPLLEMGKNVHRFNVSCEIQQSATAWCYAGKEVTEADPGGLRGTPSLFCVTAGWVLQAVSPQLPHLCLLTVFGQWKPGRRWGRAGGRRGPGVAPPVFVWAASPQTLSLLPLWASSCSIGPCGSNFRP